MINKPYSESCEQNREPILAVLREAFADRRRLLEIGSGTGQHAVYFAPELPQLVWQTADVRAYHPGIHAWLDEAALPNVLPPLELDVNQTHWHSGRYDAVFSANTLHIMGWPEVVRFFAGVGNVLEPGGVLVVYGPFNYNGQFTSDSNARFDAWLKARDPASGVRDFEAVDALAAVRIRAGSARKSAISASAYKWLCYNKNS
ncbi:MAG: methylase [Hydrogenophilales bacterium 17-61-76]|nr:MAG: methylase [Hydrogenophilales bacterium 17-61-76]